MSLADRDRVTKLIKEQWPGPKNIPNYGLVTFPQVRDGGTTDELIKLAVKIADLYYEGPDN